MFSKSLSARIEVLIDSYETHSSTRSSPHISKMWAFDYVHKETRACSLDSLSETENGILASFRAEPLLCPLRSGLVYSPKHVPLPPSFLTPQQNRLHFPIHLNFILLLLILNTRHDQFQRFRRSGVRKHDSCVLRTRIFFFTLFRKESYSNLNTETKFILSKPNFLNSR